MHKILIIEASGQKKGLGSKLVDEFISRFNENDYEFMRIHLLDKDINYCKGCKSCFKNGRCPIEDDVDEIIERISEADGIVFVSPIYGMMIAGQLKTLIDRITYTYHRPMLYDKTGAFIVSTDIGGIKPVGLYMKYIMNAMGLKVAGVYGSLSGKGISMKDLSKFSSKFESVMLDKKSPSIPRLIRFNAWKEKALRSKEIYPADYQYWEEKGWFNQEYYYDVEISTFKRIAVGIIKKRITKMLDKNIH